MDNLKETYDKIAEDYNRDHLKDDWWIEGTEKYISFFQPGDTILDIGCGTGLKSKFLADRGLKVAGLDLSDKMVEIAKREVTGVQFVVKDILEPLNLEQEFDGVFAQAVLLHIQKKEISKVLGNILAPLKSGGYFYVAIKERREGEQEEMVVKENDYGYEYERFFSYFTLEEIKKYLTDAGLKIFYETVTTSGRRNWIQVIAQKP